MPHCNDLFVWGSGPEDSWEYPGWHEAKYQAAQDQLGGAQASANQALSNLDMIKQVQQQKLDEIKQLCRCGLRTIA